MFIFTRSPSSSAVSTRGQSATVYSQTQQPTHIMRARAARK